MGAADLVGPLIKQFKASEYNKKYIIDGDVLPENHDGEDQNQLKEGQSKDGDVDNDYPIENHDGEDQNQIDEGRSNVEYGDYKDPYKDPDSLYFDLNGLIHPKVIPKMEGDTKRAKGSKVAAKLALNIVNDVNVVNPQKNLHLILDGVPSIGKFNEQKRRRQVHCDGEKTVKTLQNDIWRVEVSPGTQFMNQLGDDLLWEVSRKIREEGKHKHLQITLSDTNVEGEGEQKCVLNIMQWPLPTRSIAMHCKDTDAVILALLTHNKSLVVFRTMTEWKSKEGIIISNFRLFIIKKLMGIKDAANPNQVIDDFVLLTFFFKNDSLPNPACDKLNLEDLIDAYKKSSLPLTNNGDIIHSNFLIFLRNVASIERSKMMKGDAYVGDQVGESPVLKRGMVDREKVILGKKDLPFTPKKDAETKAKQMEGQLEKKQRRLQSLQVKGRMFGDENLDSKKSAYYNEHGYDKEQLVINYVKHVASYFKKAVTGITTCQWSYVVSCAPYFCDMAQFVENFRFDLKKTKEWMPLEHLKFVTPTECMSFLPLSYQEVNIDEINDGDAILATLKDLPLTEEEIRRNKNSDPWIIPCPSDDDQNLFPWRADYEDGDEEKNFMQNSPTGAKPFRYRLHRGME